MVDPINHPIFCKFLVQHPSGFLGGWSMQRGFSDATSCRMAGGRFSTWGVRKHMLKAILSQCKIFETTI